jgi:flavin reductase (DIM6/NTAB) family NADH-FMN oxidoreductase RutF
MSIKVNPTLEGSALRRVLGYYPTGVCVVTSLEAGGTPLGLLVGSFTSASLNPPLVAFFPDKTSASWPRIQSTGRFCVNVLAKAQQGLCKRFASKAENKFVGLDYDLSGAGSPVLPGVVAWFDCSVHAVYEAGDHFVILGRIMELDIAHPDEPLLFCRGNYGGFLSSASAG